MTRSAKSAAFTVAAVTLFSFVGTASAQTVAYHHRSTVLGDAYAGASELVRAEGAYLRDEAAAAENWVRVAAAEDQLMYQRAERRFQIKQMQLNYNQQKLTAKLDRRDAQLAAEQVAAQRLLQQAQRGSVQWPAAMLRREYASSMALVESVLRNWSPNDAASGDAYRRALATEAAVLRTRISANHDIDFNSRVAAVKTIKHLQLLADATTEIGASATLAMR